MISPKQFTSSLIRQGFDFFTGVPCSYFKDVIEQLKEEPKANYTIAANEGSALALANGAYLGGKGAVVMIQNSGLGNLLNPLTSLSIIYKIPVLLFVSGRAYGIPDEPQHEIMGKTMGSLLDSLNVEHWDLPQDWSEAESTLSQAIAKANETQSPHVFFVKKGTFKSLEVPEVSQNTYSMKRIDALKIIGENLSEEAAVFATTGKISREFFSLADRVGNFYMQGSMGHIGAVALGAALAQPERRVVVLDGDGAFMMHMGTTSTIGYYKPKKFIHLVIDNESYETTGDQDTTSTTTDFESIAKSCGYKKSFLIKNADELQKELPSLLAQEGPVLARIKVNRIPTEAIPRITTKYRSPQIAEGFKSFMKGQVRV